MMQNLEPKGIDFYNLSSNREMRLVAEEGAWDGWIVYRHKDGRWVQLKEASLEDKERILRQSWSTSGVPYVSIDT